MNESHNKAVNKWKQKNYQISITVPADIKPLLEAGAERKGKSKTQYIIDLIKKDNQ